MPRRAIGDRPLTVAERSARKRQRQGQHVEAWYRALEHIATVRTAKEARDIAQAALSNCGSRPIKR